MRIGVFVTAALLAGLAWLPGGCKKEKEAEAPPPAPAEEAAPYNLSADSNQKFLADNAAKPGVMITASGLQYRVVKAGTGKSPQSGSDVVTVTYKGSLITGQVFDQTPPGQTAEFPAGALIPGWVEALALMKEGDEWELVIPSALGYGPDGAGDAIPPNQTLVFDMSLLSVAAGAQ